MEPDIVRFYFLGPPEPLAQALTTQGSWGLEGGN